MALRGSANTLRGQGGRGGGSMTVSVGAPGFSGMPMGGAQSFVAAPAPAPSYSGPAMINPNVGMTDFWGGAVGVGDPSQYTSGIDMVRGGGFYGQGIPLVKAGEYYGRGIDMVKGGGFYGQGAYMPKTGDAYANGMYKPGTGASYANGMYMPGTGASYANGMYVAGKKDLFGKGKIDLVDKAGDYTGLEAETGRLMARAGGALGADLSAQGLSGGPIALMRQQAGVSEAVGNLATQINADKFQRESMVQEGTFGIAQGKLAEQQARSQGEYQQRGLRLAGDQARSQSDYQKRGLRLQGDTARSQADYQQRGLRLAGDQARSQADLGRRQLMLQGDTQRMQGQLQRNQLILSGDTQRQQGAISRNQLMLSGDQARMQGQLNRNQLGLQAATQNSQVSLAQAQGRAGDQQYGLGLGYQYNQLNSGNYWNWQDNMLGREQILAGNLQNPNVGVGTAPPKPGFFAPGGGPFGLW